MRHVENPQSCTMHNKPTGGNLTTDWANKLTTQGTNMLSMKENNDFSVPRMCWYGRRLYCVDHSRYDMLASLCIIIVYLGSKPFFAPSGCEYLLHDVHK